MNTMRVFFAIIPSQSTIDALNNALIPLKNDITNPHVHWILPEHWHVTLCFLKNITHLDLKHLINNVALKLKQIEPIRLELGGLECFPSQQNPRFLVLNAGPSDVLSSLSKLIYEEVKAMHYPIETRAFRGHLSIAKATKYASLDVHSIHIPPIQASEVDTLYLMESRPHQGKTCYIQTAALKLDKPKR